MQFNSNSDFPASHLPQSQWGQAARSPVPFDVADFIPCACITTRVLIRCDDALACRGVEVDDAHPLVVGGLNYLVKTAKGVLVRTPPQTLQGGAWSDSSSSNDDSFSDMEEMTAAIPIPVSVPAHHSAAAQHGAHADTNNGSLSTQIERAYWLQKTLRAAIYGQVRYGISLRKLAPPIQIMLPTSSEWVSVEWEETNESVAVKEMSWEHIRAQRDKLAEDPIKEVAAMQYLSRWSRKENERQNTMQIMQQLSMGNLDVNASLAGIMSSSSSHHNSPYCAGNNGIGNNHWTLSTLSQSTLESHIMMPLDLLSDDRNLYSIMPYCSGGELFDVLEKKNRFSEAEARYWMRQILKGLSCLKKAGVSHRDLSLENLLVHEGNVLVIDMGMCLRIPYTNQMNNQRYLILPQGICGKWHYMSPEVCKNELPFDGPAVDLWSSGVILFLMLTGFPPWERPILTDERFKYMSNGYLVQMLTEWQVGLSADAMDLLQRMFWLDPTDRLSLEQVCAHPWMNQLG